MALLGMGGKPRSLPSTATVQVSTAEKIASTPGAGTVTAADVRSKLTLSGMFSNMSLLRAVTLPDGCTVNSCRIDADEITRDPCTSSNGNVPVTVKRTGWA